MYQNSDFALLLQFAMQEGNHANAKLTLEACACNGTVLRGILNEGRGREREASNLDWLSKHLEPEARKKAF